MWRDNDHLSAILIIIVREVDASFSNEQRVAGSQVPPHDPAVQIDVELKLPRLADEELRAARVVVAYKRSARRQGEDA